MKRAEWLACVVLVGAMVAPVAAQPDKDATAPAASDELTLLSRRLSGRIKTALGDSCLGNASVALTVREATRGRTLFSRNGEKPLVPASNQKLVTAGALLTLMGPQRVLYTQLRADRVPDESGAVGNLYLVGGGNPALNIEAAYSIARSLAAAGVRRVDAVVADESYFDGQQRVPSWPQRNHPHWYGAPSSALSMNFNVVGVHARVDAGERSPRVWVDPFPSYFELVNEARAGRGSLVVRSSLLEGTQAAQRLVVSGRVRPGRTERVLRAIEDPALFCAHGFVESLGRVGIEVLGTPRKGRTPPETALLHSHPSKPLALLVHDMNKQSSNVFAETLLKVLGADMLGAPGTREKGLRVLETFMERHASLPRGCRLEDASGLSPENRLTTNALTELLLGVSRDPLVWPEFLVTLPVSGTDGTLRRRLDRTAAERLVRAKTGRLAKVVSLTGVAPVATGRRAVFSLLVNDYSCPTWKVQDAVDRLVLALVADVPRAGEPGRTFREAETSSGGNGGG